MSEKAVFKLNFMSCCSNIESVSYKYISFFKKSFYVSLLLFAFSSK